MNRIENPLDTAIRQLEEHPENTTLEIALKLAAAIPVVAIGDAIREHFLNRSRYERVRNTLIIFQAEFEALQKQWAGDRARLDGNSS